MSFLSAIHSVPTFAQSVPSSLNLSPHPAALSQSSSMAIRSQPYPHSNCGIDPRHVPRHLAVICDGNARWARQRFKPDSAGHAAVARSIKKLVRLCLLWRIPVLTLFVFSCSNMSRPTDEVDFLFVLFERELERELQCMQREGIRVSIIGDTLALPQSLKQTIQRVEEATRNNEKLHLVLAMNYSGKRDIIVACRALSEKVKRGELRVEDIDERTMDEEMENSFCEFQRPDLLIRTSGEQRLSDFMLWQTAYTEFLFVPTLWPDFGVVEFLDALETFQTRNRRYGGRV